MPYFDPLLLGARSVLAVTQSECSSIADRRGNPSNVHRIGAPMAANPSARNEPNTWVGDTGYLLVLADVDEDGGGDEVELGNLLRIRFPDRVIGISFTSGFCAWHEGRVNRGWPIERSSDLERLMAWAHLTIDLHPDPLFARRCVTSLLYGTPIVVPAGSRAREHAERGHGGLWFSDPSELTWCVEGLLDPTTRAVLGAQGRAYAEREFGSTDGFIDRVVIGCGLAPPPSPDRSRESGDAP